MDDVSKEMIKRPYYVSQCDLEKSLFDEFVKICVNEKFDYYSLFASMVFSEILNSFNINCSIIQGCKLLDNKYAERHFWIETSKNEFDIHSKIKFELNEKKITSEFSLANSPPDEYIFFDSFESCTKLLVSYKYPEKFWLKDHSNKLKDISWQSIKNFRDDMLIYFRGYYRNLITS